MRPVDAYWGHFSAKSLEISTNGSIQNELSRSLISQDFLPKSDTNRRFRRTLRNKRFFGANDTTADHRARSSWLRNLARTIEDRAADRMRLARRRAKRREGLRLHRLWIDDRSMEDML